MEMIATFGDQDFLYDIVSRVGLSKKRKDYLMDTWEEMSKISMELFYHSFTVAVRSFYGARCLDCDPKVAFFRSGVHDKGKKFFSYLVNIKGELSEEEFDEMKNHTYFGSDALIKDGFTGAAEVAYHHHSPQVPNPYPEVSFKKISSHAKLCSICDSYDATSRTDKYSRLCPSRIKTVIDHHPQLEHEIRAVKNGGSFGSLQKLCASI